MLRKDYNPLNDYLFKYVFGSEERKSITISFLNAILDLNGEGEIKDIQFMDREFDPVTDEGKLSRLDIYGVLNDDSHVNIEVQLINWHNMAQRTLYYWSRIYSSTIVKGEDYANLCRTITINIVNFKMLPQKEPHSIYGIYNQTNGHRLTNDLEIHFLEVPKTVLKNVKEMRRLDRWLAYFSNKLDESETEELAMSDMEIKRAIEAESTFMQTLKERRKYEQREAAIRDYYSGLRSYWRQGHAEGREEGREEGLAEGMEKGMEKGARENSIKIAINLLNAGIDMEIIKNSTGLTEQEINKLKH